jgi:hypothetical protein
MERRALLGSNLPSLSHAEQCPAFQTIRYLRQPRVDAAHKGGYLAAS